MNMPLDAANGFERQLAILDAEFSVSLPDRLKEISDSCHRLLEGAATPAELESLGLQVHKLAGSGATFGSPEISAAAAALEGLVNAVLAGSRAVPKKVVAELSALEAAIAERLAAAPMFPGE